MWSKYFLFGSTIIIFLLFCSEPGHGISCYECNSHYDPRCGDHFDNLTYPLTNCRLKRKAHLNMVGATMCRKMIIHAEGTTRIVRECAFLGQVGYNDGRWCLERVGTKYLTYNVCLCNNKDGCNAGNQTWKADKVNLFSVWIFFLMTFTLCSVR